MTIRDIIINTGEYDDNPVSSTASVSSVSSASSSSQVNHGGNFRYPRKKLAVARIRARLKRNSFSREGIGTSYS